MKYPFPVKHNGIEYAPGQEVPIGQEPVKENADKEKTVNEIREELRALGVTEFPSNKKADLLELLEETKKAQEAEDSDEDEEEVSEDETEEETESDEEVESNEDEDSDLLNTIANEE